MIWCMRVHKSSPAAFISSAGMFSSPRDLWFFNRAMTSLTSSKVDASISCSTVSNTFAGLCATAGLLSNSWKYSFHRKAERSVPWIVSLSLHSGNENNRFRELLNHFADKKTNIRKVSEFSLYAHEYWSFCQQNNLVALNRFRFSVRQRRSPFYKTAKLLIFFAYGQLATFFQYQIDRELSIVFKTFHAYEAMKKWPPLYWIQYFLTIRNLWRFFERLSHAVSKTYDWT